MPRYIKRYLLWYFYAVFLALAMIFGAREGLFSLGDTLGTAKLGVLMLYLAFVAYSLLATHKENFFRTLGVVNRLWWGRQIGIDLYISVALSLGLIWIVEGSFLVMALWFLPILIFANLAILPYLLLNFSAVVGPFLS